MKSGEDPYLPSVACRPHIRYFCDFYYCPSIVANLIQFCNDFTFVLPLPA
uniref:Uncharacterized protein n=1 Tax=Lepeophtheirus salmonis TaxID=72036 RepID=A0A0K2T319_LEPSM